MEKVKFEKLFYENDCNMYKRGRFLLKKYSDIPKEVITSLNNCSYLRVFVNKEEILDHLIKTSQKYEKNTVYEIGSNSDLLLENEVTEDLKENLEYFFKNSNKGILTFPTKFSNIKAILQINYIERLIPRVSLNPDNIITRYELRTSNLQERINAINELCESRI